MMLYLLRYNSLFFLDQFFAPPLDSVLRVRRLTLSLILPSLLPSAPTPAGGSYVRVSS